MEGIHWHEGAIAVWMKGKELTAPCGEHRSEHPTRLRGRDETTSQSIDTLHRSNKQRERRGEAIVQREVTLTMG